MSYSLGAIIAEYESVVDAVVRGEMAEEDGFREVLKDLEYQLKDKVDGWIAKLQSVETHMTHCHERAKEWQKREKVSEALLTRLKDYLVFSMQESSFMALKGKEGTLKLCKNPQPRLNLALPTQKVYVSHSMTSSCETAHNYPEYFKETSFYTVNTDAIKKALQAGRTLDFATLEFGHHVRIL